MKPIAVLLVFCLICCKSKLEMTKKSNQHTTVTIELSESKFKIGAPLFVNFKVQNNTETDFDFCYWQTPLEKEFTADFFEIKFKEQIIPYSGKMIKRRPPNKEDTISVKARASIAQKIEVTKAYHLEKPGTYTIKYIGSRINGLPNSNTQEFILEKE